MSQAPPGPFAYLSSSQHRSHLLFFQLSVLTVAAIFLLTHLSSFKPISVLFLCHGYFSFCLPPATCYDRQSEIDRRNQDLGHRDTERGQQKWLGAEYLQLRHTSIGFSVLPFLTTTLLIAISPVVLLFL